MHVEMVLGVKIHSLTRTEAEHWIKESIMGKVYGKVVVTPGPEFLVRAYRNTSYLSLLNEADLSLPDGMGLILWSGGKIRHRVPGVDVTCDVLRFIADHKKKAVFIMRSDGLSTKEDIERGLKKHFYGLRFIVHIESTRRNQKMNTIEILKKFEPDAIFVGLGSPYQEEWIFQHKKLLNKTKIFMGVGGTLDILSNRMKRAPQWIRKIGFEWLWRLILRPNRILRIYRAVIIFPYLVIKNYFLQK